MSSTEVIRKDQLSLSLSKKMMNSGQLLNLSKRDLAGIPGRGGLCRTLMEQYQNDKDIRLKINPGQMFFKIIIN